MSKASDTGPRIAPGKPSEIGLTNALIARVIGLASGGKSPHVFTTLARHRGLFRRWLVFASGLMPGGMLKRAETELVILYVARLMRCEYEWDHHARLGKKAGVSDEAIERIRQEEIDSARWSPREHALLNACRELHEHREIREEAWRELAAQASEAEIIELCLLVGHYQMLAMTLNTLRVPLDDAPARD
ncbi:MAG: carboxymuconolactone decarboxylase family protein [Polyangiaceae bacterium]|nr:carboxymuconolactone decarboxylase family protein [Polyangiaceae bacterium]